MTCRASVPIQAAGNSDVLLLKKDLQQLGKRLIGWWLVDASHTFPKRKPCLLMIHFQVLLIGTTISININTIILIVLLMMIINSKNINSKNIKQWDNIITIVINILDVILTTIILLSLQQTNMNILCYRIIIIFMCSHVDWNHYHGPISYVSWSFLCPLRATKYTSHQIWCKPR